MSDLASTIQAGDVILPPERELRLWMRKHVATHNLPETALHLKVEYVARGIPDKRGEWILFRTRYPEAWGYQSEFRFKARPETPWKIVRREALAEYQNAKGGEQ